MGLFLGAAAGIALYDWLSNQGQKLSITDNIMTSMTINATTNVVTECFSSLSGSQSLTITETPLTSGQQTTLSKVCQSCLASINSVYEARNALESKANQQNPGYTIQTANPCLVTLMTTGGSPSVDCSSTASNPTIGSLGVGPCTAVCSNIVVANVAQSITMTSKQDCTVTNDLTNDISQSIQGQIDASLTNQQDLSGQLGSLFFSNSEGISADLSSTMSQSVTNNMIADLSQTMYAAQYVQVQGQSVYADTVSQSFNGSMVGTLQIVNTVTDQLRQSAQYSLAQTLLNKNDTIGDLANDYLQIIQAISELVDDLATDMLLIIGAVIIALILVVSALYIFNKNFQSWTSDALKQVSDAEVKFQVAKRSDIALRQQLQNEKQHNLDMEKDRTAMKLAQQEADAKHPKSSFKMSDLLPSFSATDFLRAM